MKNIKTRLIMYFLGLFIMTMGIAFSVKSDLGVSPVSSVPYTLTCVWGIEMGRATILFHLGLVIIQIILLRKKFEIKNLLQIPVGIVFGIFTTFCNGIAERIPLPDNMPVRLILTVISFICVAFGIFLYVPADIMPLAGEGTIKTVSDLTKIDFSKVKIGFDVTMVVLSLIACLIMIHSLGSVGIGTLFSAVLVGTCHGFFTKFLGSKRDMILKMA